MTTFFIRLFSFFLLLSATGFIDSLYAQGFQASLVGGFNASQLDGDNLSGFNKMGLHTGLRIAYPLNKPLWSVEMLLHQKGSTESLSFGTPKERLSLTLNYLSIPLLFHFNEWYDPNYENYRIRLDGGLVANALFNVRSTNPFFDDSKDLFRPYDVGLTGGLGYRIGAHVMIVFRYERSLLKIYQDPLTGLRGLQSYLLNFRLEYEF